MRFAEVLGLALLALSAAGLRAQPSPEWSFPPPPPLMDTPQEKPLVEIPEEFQAPAKSDPNAFARDLLRGICPDKTGMIEKPAPQREQWEDLALEFARPAAEPEPGEGPPTAARIVARVNGDPILDDDVRPAAMQVLFGRDDAGQQVKALNAKLDNIVDRELVLQFVQWRLRKTGQMRVLDKLHEIASREFAKQWLQPMMKANHHTDEKMFEQFLRENGISLEMARRGWERDFVAIGCLCSIFRPLLGKVDLREVVAYYEAHDEEFQVEESVTWQDIFVGVGVGIDIGQQSKPTRRGPALVDPEREAILQALPVQLRSGLPVELRFGMSGVLPCREGEERQSVELPSPFPPLPLTRKQACQLVRRLTKRLRKGEDFVTLAEKYDAGDSNLRDNAEGIGHKRGEIRPQCVEPTLFRLRPGEVGIVKMENGFHIVKLLSHQEAGKKPLDHKVQKQILVTLWRGVLQKEMKRFIADLRRKSTIQLEGFSPETVQRPLEKAGPGSIGPR